MRILFSPPVSHFPQVTRNNNNNRGESKYRGLKGGGGGEAKGETKKEGERGETENQTFPLRRISSRSLLCNRAGRREAFVAMSLFLCAGKNYNKSEIEAESVHGLKRESVEKKKEA